MAAKYIIFDGHIPVVFPKTLPTSMLECELEFKGVPMKATSNGECYYSDARGWVCFVSVADVGRVHCPVDSQLLNQCICN